MLENRSGSECKLVVCLGNPGARYELTRHNAGYGVGDALLARKELCFKPIGLAGLRGELWSFDPGDGKGRYLLKPTTYMNDSGEAVDFVMRQYGISPLELLVVCDDLDLPQGRIRLRPSGSCGGQRGVKSIIEWLGTDGFPRLRVGIGRPQTSDIDIIDYVLGRWSSAELQVMEPAFEFASQSVLICIRDGLERAMNAANSWRADKVQAERQQGEPEIEKV
ncbi:MAG: aminoacyl-tRNA hydrolase [Lentisphaerae bacterium]|nr:aminoacyl-tRNA hydrolase [Lentisphaerota bacterium]